MCGSQSSVCKQIQIHQRTYIRTYTCTHLHTYTRIYIHTYARMIHKLRINARIHRVEMASISEGRVIEGRQFGLRHLVNLHTGTCTCRVYQDLGLLCQHALACILDIHHNPQQYISDELSVNTWRQTYANNMHPIIHIPGLAPNEPEIQAPLTRIPRGRPRKERYRRDARGQRGLQRARNAQVKEAKQRCSTCQGIGHNARKCRNPHM